MKRVIPILLVVVVAVCAFFFVAKNQAGASFQYKFTPGQTDKYKTTMEMSMDMPGIARQGGMKINASFITTQKVLSVNWKGAAKMEVALSNFQMNMPGMPAGMVPNTPDQKFTMTINKDGKVENVEGLDGISNNTNLKDFINQMSSYQLPCRRLNLGETWETHAAMPFGGEMKVTSKLAAQDVPIAGVAAAKITQEFKGQCSLDEIAKNIPNSQTSGNTPAPKGTMDLDGHGVIYFSPIEGKLVESHTATTATVKMDVPAGVPGAPAGGQMDVKMDIKVHMTKV